MHFVPPRLLNFLAITVDSDYFEWTGNTQQELHSQLNDLDNAPVPAHLQNWLFDNNHCPLLKEQGTHFVD